MKSEYTIVLIYSALNLKSMRNKMIVSGLVEEAAIGDEIVIQEIEYERYKNRLHQYGVMGTPALLVFTNGRLIKRYFGEITADELRWVLK